MRGINKHFPARSIVEFSIIVDKRERNIAILEGLEESGINVMMAQLPVADYVVSDRMCVERKTVTDFEKSIMDNRLFDQLERMSAAFKKPILLIEGEDSDFMLNKNVIIGTIIASFADFNVQVVRSHDEHETAAMLAKLAEREQDHTRREPRVLGSKRAHSTQDWQVLILASMPGVGPKLAKSLIKHFKSIRSIVLADKDELQEVDKIGKKKAEHIHKILNAVFEEQEEELIME